MKKYQPNLIKFPLNPAKPYKSDCSAEECKMATHLSCVIVSLQPSYVLEKAPAINKEEMKDLVFQEMRVARSHVLGNPRQAQEGS